MDIYFGFVTKVRIQKNKGNWHFVNAKYNGFTYFYITYS